MVIERIDFSRDFDKQFKKASLEVKLAFRSAIDLFLRNPYDPRLHNTLLVGKYVGYRSIFVTGDMRAVYYEAYGEKGFVIEFVALDLQDKLFS